MAEETAPTTSVNANKRVRFETIEDDTPKKVTNKSQSPKALALHSLGSFSAMLQPDLGTVLKNLGTEWIDIIVKYRSKTTQVLKMLEDDDYIPHSVPTVDFKFYVSREAEDNAEFTIIKEDTAAAILEFRKTIKSQIIKAMRVEITLLEQRAKKHFLHAVTTVTKATLISARANVASLNRIVNSIMEFNHEQLLDEAGLNYAEFCAQYKLMYGITRFPFEDNPDPNSDITPELHRQQRIKDAAPSKINILATLITPIEIFISREKDIETSITLKKLITTEEVEKSSEDTQTRMDLEGSVDTELLKEMIDKSTIDKTKSLRSEIGQLKKLVKDLSSKKEGRGQSGGASTTLKKKTKTQKGKGNGKATAATQRSPSPSARKNNRAPRGQRADAQGKDSRPKKPKNQRRKGNGKK